MEELHPDEKPLGMLVADPAWSTPHKVEKKTKTKTIPRLPVHPVLDAMLRDWKRKGWAKTFGRAPGPEDLIVPRLGGSTRNWEAGLPRNVGVTWRSFQEDLVAVGLQPQEHYETRATFRSLALAGGADLHAVDLITHPSPKQAKDLYERRGSSGLVSVMQ